MAIGGLGGDDDSVLSIKTGDTKFLVVRATGTERLGRLPEFAKYQMGALVAGVKYDPAHVQEGTMLYVNNCVFCHGVPGVDRGGNVKNLGYISSEMLANLQTMVFKGPFVSQGMPDFTGKLTPEQVTKIRGILESLSLTIATPDEARSMLALKGANQVAF